MNKILFLIVALAFGLANSVYAQDTLFKQGFNNGSMPAGWTTTVTNEVNPTAPPSLTFETVSSNPDGFNPTEGTHMLKFNTFNCPDKSAIRLNSSSFSTVGKNNIKVSFDWLKSIDYDTNPDSIHVEYSTDGTTWHRVGSAARVGATTQWENISITLPTAAEEQANLYVGFLFVSGWGNNCFFDNVVVTGENSVVYADDISLTHILNPTNGYLVENDTVKVKVKNYGTNAAGAFDVSYSIDGAAFISQNIAAGLASGADTIIKFTNAVANMTEYKTYNCIAAVSMAGDLNNSNDTLTTTITKTRALQTIKCYPKSEPLWTGSAKSTEIADSSLVHFIASSAQVGWMKFDISTIPAEVDIQSVKLNAYNETDDYPYFKIFSLENDPVTSTAASIFNDAKDGNMYFDYTNNNNDNTWFTVDLGYQAKNDLISKMSQNWFGIGFHEYENGAFFAKLHGWREINIPYIEVSYYMPIAIDAAMEKINVASAYNIPEKLSVTIKNTGTTDITKVPISYKLNNNAIVSATTPDDVVIEPQATYTYTFTNPLGADTVGNYAITAYVAYTGDIWQANDTAVVSFDKWAKFYPLVLNKELKLNDSTIIPAYDAEYFNGKWYYSLLARNKVLATDNNLIPTNLYTIKGFAANQYFRDITHDNDNLFSSKAATALYKDSIGTDTIYLQNTATTPRSVRAMAYDPIKDGIWYGNFSYQNIFLTNRLTGAHIDTVETTGLETAGLAYDYWTPGGPYIVSASQHGSKNQLVWIKIENNNVIVDHNILQDIPDGEDKFIGGAYCTSQAFNGEVLLGGVMQSYKMFGYQIASTGISEYSMPGQDSAKIDAVAKEINIYFGQSATLSNIAPTFTLNDYHNLAKAFVNGVEQTSGTSNVSVANGDVLTYSVKRMNINNTDSVFTDWKIIIHVKAVEETIAITPTNQSVSPAAGTATFNVTSNAAWTVVSDQTWCTVTTSGTGNGTITATYEANTGTARTATITATTTAGKVATATLAQEEFVGIEEANAQMIVYPNPSEGVFNITINNNNCNIEVIDLLGNIILRDIFSNNYKLDMSTNAKGAYFVRISFADKTMTQKIVLQ